MDFSIEELKIINEALRKSKAISETEGFETEKRSIDSNSISSKENVNTLIQEMYRQLLQKIEDAIKEMKDE